VKAKNPRLLGAILILVAILGYMAGPIFAALLDVPKRDEGEFFLVVRIACAALGGSGVLLVAFGGTGSGRTPVCGRCGSPMVSVCLQCRKGVSREGPPE
jgi:hypothetical protein